MAEEANVPSISLEAASEICCWFGQTHDEKWGVNPEEQSQLTVRTSF